MSTTKVKGARGPHAAKPKVAKAKPKQDLLVESRLEDGTSCPEDVLEEFDDLSETNEKLAQPKLKREKTNTPRKQYTQITPEVAANIKEAVGQGAPKKYLATKYNTTVFQINKTLGGRGPHAA